MKMPDESASPPSLEISTTVLPSADSVRAGLAKLNPTTEQVDTVLWLLHYGPSQRGAKSRGDLAQLIGSSTTSVSKVLSGTYEGNLEAFCSKIRSFRGGMGIARTEWPIAPLRITRDIAAFCDATRKVRQMSILWGINQTGKSEALMAYAAAPREERTFYMALSEGGSTRRFMRDFARACGFSNTSNYDRISELIPGFFRPGDLVIIDEFHQALIGGRLRMSTIEAIRLGIFEKCHCGVVLCGTDVIPEMMQQPKFAPFLQQTDNRGAMRLQIPREPYKEDLCAVFQAYGFPFLGAGPARDAAVKIAAEFGLGRVCRQLQIACSMAEKRGEPRSHEHYLAAVDTMRGWAKGAKFGSDNWPQAPTAGGAQ